MDLLDEGSDEETVYHQDIDEDDLLGGSDEDEGGVHSSSASTRKPIIYSSHGNGNYVEQNPESEDEDVLELTLGDIDELELPQSVERKSNTKPVRVVKYAGAGSQTQYVQLPPSDFSNFEHSQIQFSEDHKVGGGRSEQNNNAVGKPIQTLGQQRTVHNFQSQPGLRHRNPNQPQIRRMGGRNFNLQNQPNHLLPHQPRNFYPRPRPGQGYRPHPSILGNGPGPVNFGEVRPGMIRHGPPVFPFQDQQVPFKTIPAHLQMQQQFPHNNLNPGAPHFMNQGQVRQMGTRNFNHPNPQPRPFYPPRPEVPDPSILGRGPPNHVGHGPPPQMFPFPDQQQQQQQMGPSLLPAPINLPMHQFPQINPGPPPPPQPQPPPFGFGGPPIQMQNWNMNMNMGQPPNSLPPGQYFQPSYPDFVPQMYPQQQQQQQQQLQPLQQQNMFIPNRQNEESFYQMPTMHPPPPSPSVQYNNMNMPIQNNGHLHSQSHEPREQYSDRDYGRQRERDHEYDRDREREREGRYNSSSEYKLSAGKRKLEYRRDEYSSGIPEKRVQSRLGPPVRTRRVESKEDQIVKIMLQTKKEMGLEVDKAYLQKLEEQKQKRAEVLRLKEERRKMALSSGVESKKEVAAGTEETKTNVKVKPSPSKRSNSDGVQAGPSRSGGAGTEAASHSIHINPLAFKGDLTLLNNNLKKINMNVSSASSAPTTTSTSTGGESSRSQQQHGPSDQFKRQVTISTTQTVGGNSERPRKILRIVKNKNGEVISKSKVIVMRKQNQD